jgi:hypothetical protein
MDGDERKALKEFDDAKILYRGYHDERRLRRFSWTTHEQNAARFALLWHDIDGGTPMIARARAPKSSVLVLWSFEAEVVADPDHVLVLETYPVPERYWPMFQYEDSFRERFGRNPKTD